jgi:predicted TPR repeat methyltransferase
VVKEGIWRRGEGITMKSSIQAHDQSAIDYDQQVREYHCYAADVLFGLCFEYVHPRERLLDLGIGTGLSALPFAQLGLQLFGVDASQEMLNICRAKNIAVELKQFDLEDTPLPYADDSFDHVVSCGVLHFFDDLAIIFQEVARVIRPNGIFAFTIKAPPNEITAIAEETTDGVTIFMHSGAYIAQCIANSQFEMLKELRFFVGNNRDQYAELFCAFVVRRKI